MTERRRVSIIQGKPGDVNCSWPSFLLGVENSTFYRLRLTLSARGYDDPAQQLWRGYHSAEFGVIHHHLPPSIRFSQGSLLNEWG